MAQRLKADGWTLLSQNWHGGGGELDLVIQRGSALRFVEVKARVGDDFDIWDAIPASKRARLVRAARAWLAAHDTDAEELCFLWAAVRGGAMPEEWSVEWYDNPIDVRSA